MYIKYPQNDNYCGSVLLDSLADLKLDAMSLPVDCVLLVDCRSIYYAFCGFTPEILYVFYRKLHHGQITDIVGQKTL